MKLRLPLRRLPTREKYIADTRYLLGMADDRLPPSRFRIAKPGLMSAGSRKTSSSRRRLAVIGTPRGPAHVSDYVY